MDNKTKDILTKRFQTTMIGSLYVFEQYFGYLWGLNSDKELTPLQKQLETRWEDARNEILNNGNSQLRKCLSDMEKITNVKYKYHMYKRKDDL